MMCPTVVVSGGAVIVSAVNLSIMP
jgi:hypothetical protein